MALEPLPFRGLPPPPGFAMFFYIPAFAAPWKGAQWEEASNAAMASSGKGLNPPPLNVDQRLA